MKCDCCELDYPKETIKPYGKKHYCYQCRNALRSRHPHRQQHWLQHTLQEIGQPTAEDDIPVRCQDIYVPAADSPQPGNKHLGSKHYVQQRLQEEKRHDPCAKLASQVAKPPLPSNMHKTWIEQLEQQSAGEGYTNQVKWNFAMHLLNEKQRGVSYQQLADALGIPVKKVKQTLRWLRLRKTT